jgi:hypothetical protein
MGLGVEDVPFGGRAGKPQNEIKHTGKPVFEQLYSDPDRLEQFINAMAGISLGPFHALAETVDFSTRPAAWLRTGRPDGQAIGLIPAASRHESVRTGSLRRRTWKRV